MNKFEEMIYNSGLYSGEFIKAFGISSPHWFSSNWHSRELSLRHDMVCVLLCNLQEFSIEETIKSSISSSRTGTLTEPSDEAAPTPSLDIPRDILDFEPDVEAIEAGDAESEMKDIDQQRIMDEEYTKRFILLEGTSNVAQKQNICADMWECERPNSQWDIIDRELKKFIEVKVTTNLREAVEAYEDKSQGLEGNTALFHVHPTTAQCYWANHPGGLAGEAKVTNFLIRRFQYSSTRANTNPLAEEGELEKRIFCNDRFNRMVKEWYTPFWSARNDAPIMDSHMWERQPKGVKPKDLLAVLEDPRLRYEAEEVKLRMKILPEMMVHNYITTSCEDAEIMDLMIKECWGNLLSFEGGEGLVKAAIQLLKHWTLRPSDRNNFKFLSQRELERDPSLRLESKYLGILAKKKIRNDGDNTTKQPEYSEAKKMRYGPWFDCMMKDLSKKTLDRFEPMAQLAREENDTRHPMAMVSQRVATFLVNSFIGTYAAVTASKCTGIYSRLGGSYLTGEGKGSAHSYAAMMPIYATCTAKNGDVIRKVHGILIRAPQHAKSSTDRINMITIEMVDRVSRSMAYAKKVYKAT